MQSTYQKLITDNKVKLKTLKQNLFISSMIRLSTFIVALYLVITYYQQPSIVITIITLWIALFLLMLSKHSNLQNQKKYIQTLISLNQNEIQALQGNLKAFNSGETYKNPQHHFSYDIDLFGKNSLFHHINRTNRKESEKQLAHILTQNHITEIPQKQDAIKELSQQLKWRQNFTVNTKLIETEVSTKSIFEWLNNYNPTISKKLYQLALIYPSITLIIFTLNIIGTIPHTYLLYLLLTGLGITSIQLKKINKLSAQASEFKNIMSQYVKLLVAIENKTFKTQLLKAKQEKITTTSPKKASSKLKEFSKHINALDQRNNMLFGVIGNGYLLWDIKQVYKIEQWIKNHHQQVQQWFQIIEFFEAYNSLANFAYNHHSFTYPKIVNQGVIDAQQLGHFIIPAQKRITNNFKIDQNQFIIITGANMAGKSTFLRTVAINIVCANVGLPVCAKTFNYNPIKLISSMRTSDSLLDNESYFFSELKRLKFIVNQIQEHRYFIILDEILKGTNSKDKEEGSKQFIKKIVKSKSTGIIATHDLGLCNISKQLPQVINKYFDAEIKNNQLYFDYTYKDGVCQNMNASFLLKKMQIVD